MTAEYRAAFRVAFDFLARWLGEDCGAAGYWDGVCADMERCWMAAGCGELVRDLLVDCYGALERAAAA